MKILFILFALAMQTAAWSQNWIDSYNDASISIKVSKIDYESVSDGIHHERIIFSYSNHTDQVLHLTFDRKIAYNLEELPQSPERSFELVIPANSTLSYGEENKYDKTYYVFSKDLKGTIKKQLSGFEIINVEYN
jgi:hypothetical protein